MLEFLIFLTIAIVLSFFSVVIVNQGTIAIVTLFGKYQRIMLPGLRFRIPFIESIFRRVSIQNQSIELEFQAVTIDQANVYFKAMLLYAVINQNEEIINYCIGCYFGHSMYYSKRIYDIECIITIG